MSQARIDAMTQFVKQRPADPFPHYALALEFKNAGRGDEAVTTFEALVEKHPGYVPSYLMFGGLLRDLGRAEQAKAVVRRGIEAAQASNNGHALGELQGLLAELDD